MTQKVSLQRIRQIIKEEMRKMSEADDFDDIVMGKPIAGVISNRDIVKTIRTLTGVTIRFLYDQDYLPMAASPTALEFIKKHSSFKKLSESQFEPYINELLEILASSHMSGPYINFMADGDFYPDLFKLIDDGQPELGIRVNRGLSISDEDIQKYIKLRIEEVESYFSSYL